MNFVKVLAFFVLSSVMNSSYAECWLEDKVTGKKFRIFNALLYEDMRETNSLCIEKINMLYSWRFFPRGHKDRMTEMPKNKDIKTVIDSISDSNTLNVIDVEHWDLKSDKHARKSAENYFNLIASLKSMSPDKKFGYYGVVPIVDFSRAKQSKKSAQYKRWVRENSRLSKVADQVDATLPSLYTINSNRKHWLSRATGQISEARRLAVNKPVYPFIWPDYHTQGGKYPKGYEIEADYWRLQLDYLRNNADGIVLWGGYKQTFSENMKWWQETIRFINESFYIKQTL